MPSTAATSRVTGVPQGPRVVRLPGSNNKGDTNVRVQQLDVPSPFRVRTLAAHQTKVVQPQGRSRSQRSDPTLRRDAGRSAVIYHNSRWVLRATTTLTRGRRAYTKTRLLEMPRLH